jgi:hypothetical protein
MDIVPAFIANLQAPPAVYPTDGALRNLPPRRQAVQRTAL